MKTKLLCFLSVFLLAGCTQNISHTAAPESVTQSVKSIKKSKSQLALIGCNKLNHEIIPLSIGNSAHTYNQQLCTPLEDYMNAVDRDGVINGSDTNNVTVTIKQASSDYRCVVTAYFSSECIVRIRMSGDIKAANTSKPFSFEQEAGGTSTVTESSQIAGQRIMSDLKKTVAALAY